MRAFWCAAVAAATVSVNGANVEQQNRPVTKVVNLLKDMLKQLEKEAEEDEEIYDKLACWCATNDREKTKAVADAQAKIKDLTTSIEDLTAASARLTVEIKNLKKEVAANQAALDQATSIRQKELAEFNAEEKDLLLSTQSLGSAITVLSKKGAAFLQVDNANIQGVASTVEYQMQKHTALLQGVLTHKERKAVTAFAANPMETLVQTNNKNKYAPQSGEIFGILGAMKESFEINLSELQKDEAENVKAYTELKAAKEEEIAAGQEQIDKKTMELANADETLAQNKEDIVDTKKTLEEDEAFLLMLKEKCSTTDSEWEERQKARALEMEACSKALAVLNSDEAHELFTKTFKAASFLQKAQVSERRSAAAKVLKATADKIHSPRLAALSVKVRLDAFTKVKKAIDDMMTQLAAEQKDEQKHKDFCTEEFNTNQLETERKEREKEDLLAEIEDLTQTIKTLTSDIDQLKSEIAEESLQMKRAGEDREKENGEFQQVIADQRASQRLLKAALDILKGVYEKAGLLQNGQEPPAGFGEYKQNENSGGVMKMIQEIINDAKNMENEAIRAEEDAQKSYEDFVKDTNASVQAKTKEMANKVEEKAKAEKDLNQANEDKDAAMLELEQLSNYNAELHKSCDFVMKNFEIRQTARAEEIEALRQAKAILSGAKFIQLLTQA
jgi:chromosome segregation ATPase